MASIEEKTKYITMCSSIIRENHSGDPLNLSSFLDKINLIEEIITDNLGTCFISFIKSKLDGKAREVLPDEITSVSQIKDALKNRIRPDSSKVVAGRITGLSIKQNNYADFAKNVEDLADALERSLVIEGVTREKAHEMTIEQTVSVCRNNARSDMVKAILASSTFKEPKDVVAKLVIEESNTEKQAQVLSMHYNENSNNFKHRNPRTNWYARRGNKNKYGNRLHSNDFYGQRSSASTGNYSTRGGYNNNNNRPNRGRNNRRNAYVRTLNVDAPQQELLGGREEQQN